MFINKFSVFVALNILKLKHFGTVKTGGLARHLQIRVVATMRVLITYTIHFALLMDIYGPTNYHYKASNPTARLCRLLPLTKEKRTGGDARGGYILLPAPL